MTVPYCNDLYISSYLKSLDSAGDNEKMAKELQYYVSDRRITAEDRNAYTGGPTPYECAAQPGSYLPRFAVLLVCLRRSSHRLWTLQHKNYNSE